MSRPDPRFAGRENSLRVEGILDGLLHLEQGTVVPFIGAGDRVHVLDVSAVFAYPSAAASLTIRLKHSSSRRRSSALVLSYTMTVTWCSSRKPMAIRPM